MRSFNSGLVARTIINLVRELDFTTFYWGYLVKVGVANLVYFIFSIRKALSYVPAEGFEAESIELNWETVGSELK